MGISKRYNVTVDDEFGKESDGDFSFMADGLAVTGTGFMTTETDDMKQLKKLYKQKREIKDDAAYIFILKKAKTDDGSEVAGDMPRSHQVGYVFSEDAKYSDGKTIAHELGHGLYSFEHTFENKGAKQGSTDNLMDYNDGIADKMLKVWQWNLLYTHKNYTVPFLEDDEDAMAFGKPSYAFCFDDYELSSKLKLYRYFYIPDGRIIDLNKNNNIYLPCGFFTMSDSYEPARGSIFCFDIDSYRGVHVYNKNTTNTIGYGFVDGKVLLPVENILSDNQNVNAYRVYRDEFGLKLIDGNNKEERIFYEFNTCSCSEETMMTSPLANNMDLHYYHSYYYYVNAGKYVDLKFDNVETLPLSDIEEKNTINHSRYYFYEIEKNVLDNYTEQSYESLDEDYNKEEKRENLLNLLHSMNENSSSVYEINSPQTVSSIKSTKVNVEKVDVKNLFEKSSYKWIKQNWKETSVTDNPKGNRQKFLMASQKNHDLDIAQYYTLSDNKIYAISHTGGDVYYSSQELRYFMYGYTCAKMMLNFYETSYAAVNFFDKENNENPENWPNKYYHQEVIRPWLIDAVYDGWSLFNGTTPDYSINMFTWYRPYFSHYYIPLDYDLGDLSIDIMTISMSFGMKTSLYVGKVTAGMLLDALLQVTLQMTLGDKSFSEAAGNVNWSDVAYSGIEVTYPKWYMAVASAIGRDILTQRLRNSTEISLLELTKKYSLIVLSNALGTFFGGDLTKVNNIDLKIKWYIKDALSYNFKFAIHSLHTNGFDRNTLEWFLSDLGFRIFTNDQKAVIEKEYE